MAMLIVSGVVGSALHADIIANYSTAGLGGTEATVSHNFAGIGISNLALSRGAGLGSKSRANTFNSIGWNNPGSTDYLSFGFVVDAGYQVDLTSLSIGTQSSNKGPSSLSLRYSGDGFSSSLFTFSESTVPNHLVIDLSNLAGLTGNVEFRIYSNGNTAANGTSVNSQGEFWVMNYFSGNVDTGSFGFEGTIIAVPEPAAIVVVLTAIVRVTLRRNRRSARPHRQLPA
jgi:hypothetical protein